MRVEQLIRPEELGPFEADWDRLADGVPFRRAAWQQAWWAAYGAADGQPAPAAQLCVLVVRDAADRIVGIAPWYVEQSLALGRALRFLGDGEVCSDFLGLLVEPGREADVAAALADWLHGAAPGAARGKCPLAWDLLRFDEINADEPAHRALLAALAHRGATVFQHPGVQCWRRPLAESREALFAEFSKGHRKQLNRLLRRYFEAGRARVRRAESLEEHERAFARLVALHQLRWERAGEGGCFASPRFLAFHAAMAAQWHAAGLARLYWLELDGEPIAVDYYLLGRPVAYAYQGGLDPDRLDDEPGRLLMLGVLDDLRADGFTAVDFLRGDEPYKAHWRAEPRRMQRVRVVANRPLAQWRYRAWLTGKSLKALWSRRADEHASEPADEAAAEEPASLVTACADRAAALLRALAGLGWSRSR